MVFCCFSTKKPMPPLSSPRCSASRYTGKASTSMLTALGSMTFLTISIRSPTYSGP